MKKETFGERLRRLREARGMGVRELGRRSGVNHATLSLAERNQRWVDQLPSIEVVENLATALGLTVEELRGITEPSQQVAEAPAAYDEETARLAEIGRQVVDLVKREALSFVIPTERIEIVPDRPAEPMIEVPVYDRFAASYLGSSGGQAGDRMSVPQRLWKRAQEPRLIYVSGPCLALRGILSGDYLVVDAANRDPRNGDVVAFRFRGEEAVKVCFRFDDRIEFRPTIETFPTITVRLGEEEDLEIVGVSVGLVQCAERG